MVIIERFNNFIWWMIKSLLLLIRFSKFGLGFFECGFISRFREYFKEAVSYFAMVNVYLENK